MGRADTAAAVTHIDFDLRVDIVLMKSVARCPTTRRRALPRRDDDAVAVVNAETSSHDGVRTPTIFQAESQGGVRVPVSV